MIHSRDSCALAMPGVHGKVAYNMHDDIPAVLANVLTEPGHENKTYEITGSEAPDLFELAAVLSEARLPRNRA